MTPKHMPTPIPASSGIESGQQQFVKDLASIGIVPTNGDQGMVNEGERLCGEMASGNTREKRLLLYLKLQRFCGSVKRRATQKTFSVRSTDLPGRLRLIPPRCASGVADAVPAGACFGSR